jgi:hypothetical protein
MLIPAQVAATNRQSQLVVPTAVITGLTPIGLVVAILLAPAIHKQLPIIKMGEKMRTVIPVMRNGRAKGLTIVKV